MNKQLKAALKHNFTPPPTQRREQFIHSIPYPKASPRQVLLAQIAYIRKRVWILLAIGTGFAFFYTHITVAPENIVAGVSALLPLFSLCTIMELYKSTTCHMEEIELSCTYNLPKIMLMRITILGTVGFAALVLLVVMVEKSDFGALRNTLYIGVPYLLASYLSLLVALKSHTKGTMYICAAISVSVSGAMLVSSKYQYIYSTHLTSIWVTLFSLLIGLLAYTYIRFMQSQEELLWNLS